MTKIRNDDKVYIVALVFILGLSLLGDKLYMFVKTDIISHFQYKIIYTLVLSIIFTLIYFLVLREKEPRENFFFTVSKCNPKCSGGYYGKPATFQFTPLSPNGTTCKDQNCGYGMISECDHPECKGVLQKYGGSNDLNSLQPSQQSQQS